MVNFKKKIKIFVDGANIEQIKSFEKIVDWYTFNPTLFKKLGASNYIEFAKDILIHTNNKPVSIEVFADDEENCLKQARILKNLAENVVVKIPITYTDGQSTENLIKKLSEEKINLNITAIFTLEQIKKIMKTVKNTNHILSIFAGRIYDIGHDAQEAMQKINKYVHNNSNCITLWASCRMVYDLISAQKVNTDIITMPPEFIKKINNFDKTLDEYSLETVKGFYNDAFNSGFKI